MNRSILFATACAVTLAGCSLRASAPPPAVHIDTAPVAVDVEPPPPVDIEVYPRTVYEGRTVYFYHDRWYYRDGPRWRYYREEPGFLIEHRHRFFAPPRRDHDERRQHDDRHHR